MKFTLSWLKEFLETEASLEEISHALTMSGLEVEHIENKAENLADFQVAEIISAEKHPQADKLNICQVRTKNEQLQIVCGANNARAGIKVVLARVGTLIPNGNFKIKETKIRGVDSIGMLCSAEELNIELNIDGGSSGIIELDSNAVIGDPVASYLGVDDPIIHINITPNRADALGVYGIARDLAAVGIGTLKELSVPKITGSFKTNYRLEVADDKACPLFAMREIRLSQNLSSPTKLKNLLNNIGIGSISSVVDVTNYISYSFGQPMHAYDADKITGGLQIRILDSKNEFMALNDKEYELREGDLIIKDEREIQCLAGIIGGTASACTENTKNIILEAASFSAEYISRTGRRLHIDTDSRYRFERNVDREFTLKALDFATNLILEICGGNASDAVFIGEEKLPIRKIEFPFNFLFARTNLDLSTNEIVSILEKLGFQCLVKSEFIEITVPGRRYDVTIKEDIVEEIVRIYGYDKLPENRLPTPEISRVIPAYYKRMSDVKRILATRGYTEIVSRSFTDSKYAALFSEIKEELTLENPISSDLDYMRPSILPNLLQICRNNFNRSFFNLSLFEVGPIFKDVSADVINHACGIRTGSVAEKNPHGEKRYFDLFDIKADVAALLDQIGLDIDKCQITANAPNYYHPTRSASLALGKNILGYFGQIHPHVLKNYDIETDILAFELNISALPYGKGKFGRRSDYIVSDYQMITRDYAFIIDKDIPAGDLLNFIKNIDKNLIRSVNIFDIYSGNKIEVGKKSIALSVNIQDDKKTLNEEDINLINRKIIDGVKQKFAAVLRDGF